MNAKMALKSKILLAIQQLIGHNLSSRAKTRRYTLQWYDINLKFQKNEE